MFAPPIKAPKAKTASQAPPAHKSKAPVAAPKLLNQSEAPSPFWQPKLAIGPVNDPLKPLQQRSVQQAADPERTASPEGARGGSWDLRKIPLFAPNRPSGPEAPRPFIQPKLM